MFKLSRITDLPVRVSRPGAYAVPEGLDLRALARRARPAGADGRGPARRPSGPAPSLTRRGRRPEATPDLAWAPDGYERWWVGYGSLPGMADEVAGHGRRRARASSRPTCARPSSAGCDAVAGTVAGETAVDASQPVGAR